MTTKKVELVEGRDGAAIVARNRLPACLAPPRTSIDEAALAAYRRGWAAGRMLLELQEPLATSALLNGIIQGCLCEEFDETHFQWMFKHQEIRANRLLSTRIKSIAKERRTRSDSDAPPSGPTAPTRLESVTGWKVAAVREKLRR